MTESITFMLQVITQLYQVGLDDKFNLSGDNIYIIIIRGVRAKKVQVYNNISKEALRPFLLSPLAIVIKKSDKNICKKMVFSSPVSPSQQSHKDAV